MRWLLVSGILIAFVAAAGTAIAAHPVLVNGPDESQFSSDTVKAPQGEYRLARYWRYCYCCWYTRRGIVCKTTSVKRCSRLGGWCR